MEFSKKPIAFVLSFAIVITVLFAVPTLFAVEAAPDARNVNNVTLDVGAGKIVLYTDHYTQNGVEYGGFDCENTVYTITGIVNRTDSALCVYQVAEDAPAVTFNVVFRDLAILGEQWCSVVHFTTAQIAGEGEPSHLTVDLRLEGRNYLGGHSHPGLSGNATVNLTAAPGSYSVFTAEYSDTPEAFASGLTLNKFGTYDVKVAGEAAELEAGKSAKPVVIIGQDPAEIVKTQIDALPAATDVTLSDKNAITAARTAYAALPAEKQAMIDADTLQHLADDEAALAAADTPPEQPAKNLTALWVVLAFVGGAACAALAVVILYKTKKKPVTDQTDADAQPPSAD